MSFSCIAKETMDKLDYETFNEGDIVHLRIKSTQAPLNPQEEKRVFMELYEKYGVEIRAQFKTHDGFWGTGMRNDHPGQRDMTLPQGLGLYEWNKHNSQEPSVDIWPRMYSEAWLKSGN